MADIDGDHIETLSYNSWTQAYAGAVATDTTAPTVTIVSPPAGGLIGPTEDIVVEAADETALRRVVLLAKYTPYQPEVIWDGYSFQRPFVASSHVGVGTAIQFTITRTGGWPASPSLQVIAIDTAGNEA